MKLLANTDTKENEEFWTFVEKVADEVKQWPEWKKMGISTVIEEKLSEENPADQRTNLEE